MPHKTGPGTYKGYESPNTSGWPEEIRDEVRRVYGAWRVKNPGENPSTKARGARIAWFTAKRKYPKLFRQHKKDARRLAIETKKELKEHPWAGKKTAGRIAEDHILKEKTQYRGSHLGKNPAKMRRSKAEKYDMEEARVATVTGR
jgi:hypothetical protein